MKESLKILGFAIFFVVLYSILMKVFSFESVVIGMLSVIVAYVVSIELRVK
jgi:hypothetical protein